MALLNPFHELFETEQYPHARTYRTTFKQKCWDTFYVFFGDLGILADISRNETNSTRGSAHFGIYDYLTLGIPYFLNQLFMFALQASITSSSAAAKIFSSSAVFLIDLPLLIFPRFAFSAAMTLLCLPFIAIAHGIASLKGNALKAQIKNLQIQQDKHGCIETTTLGQLLKTKGMRLEEIKDADYNLSSKQSKINLRLRKGEHQLHLLFDLGKTDDAEAYMSLRKLNIADIQYHAEQKEKNPSLHQR